MSPPKAFSFYHDHHSCLTIELLVCAITALAKWHQIRQNVRASQRAIMRYRTATYLRTAAAMLFAGLLTVSAPATTPQDVLDAAPAAAWRDVPAADMMVMQLANGAQAVVQLAPDFAPVHVANIRAFVRAGWFDGGAIVRVQDNYVVQWAARAQPGRPVPPGVAAKPPAEYDMADVGGAFRPLGYRDSYAAETGHVGGWTVAREGGRRWLTHCYGMVGVGRDNAPDTGNGAELYAVIGQAPRQLDRNIALVGRVLAGMERMASLPRGTEALGFYRTPAERVSILSTRMASDMPAATRPTYQILNTDSATFTAWTRVRANRQDAFYVRPAGALDICNALPPVRPHP